jgi:hypothetical protein
VLATGRETVTAAAQEQQREHHERSSPGHRSIVRRSKDRVAEFPIALGDEEPATRKARAAKTSGRLLKTRDGAWTGAIIHGSETAHESRDVEIARRRTLRIELLVSAD